MRDLADCEFNPYETKLINSARREAIQMMLRSAYWHSLPSGSFKETVRNVREDLHRLKLKTLKPISQEEADAIDTFIENFKKGIRADKTPEHWNLWIRSGAYQELEDTLNELFTRHP